MFQSLADAFNEQIMVDRFGKEIIGTLFHRLHCRFHSIEPGQHDGDGVFARVGNKFSNITARDIRQTDIKQGHIKLFFLEKIYRGTAAQSFSAGKVVMIENTLQSVDKSLLIVNQQYFDFILHIGLHIHPYARGREISKRVPPS